MRIQPKILNTSFGTHLIGSPKQKKEMWLVSETSKVLLDTPIEAEKGTEKIFLPPTVVEGTIWREVDKRSKRQRDVLMVQDENGRYLIPLKNLNPTTKEQADMNKDMKDISEKVEDLLKKAEAESKEIIKSSEGFLDKEYAGFTGKQILVGALGVIILVKLFK